MNQKSSLREDPQFVSGVLTGNSLEAGSVAPSFEIIQRMTHPEDRLSGDELGEFLKVGIPFDRQYRVIKANGRIRWIASRAEMLLDSNGRPTGAVGVSFDVTKHQEQLQHHKHTAGRYQALVDSIHGAAWIVDNAGNIIRFLKSDNLIEDAADHVTSLCWLDYVNPDDRVAMEQTLMRSASSPTRQVFEHRIRQSSGALRWVRTVVVPVFDDERRSQEWLYVSNDIDLEKQYIPSEVDLPRLTGAQIRGARGMLAWSVKELSDAAQVSPTTIRRYEEINGANAFEAALGKLHVAFVDAGIEFIFPTAGQPGVRPQSQRGLAVRYPNSN